MSQLKGYYVLALSYVNPIMFKPFKIMSIYNAGLQGEKGEKLCAGGVGEYIRQISIPFWSNCYVQGVNHDLWISFVSKLFFRKNELFFIFCRMLICKMSRQCWCGAGLL